MSKLSIDANKIKAFVLDVDGVLSASKVQIGEDGQPVRTANVKDGLAIRMALSQGYLIAVITGGRSEEVPLRFKLLGVADVFNNVSKKLPVYEQWRLDNGLEEEEIAYMGDDIPDLPCMRHCGLPSAPFDAATEALQTALFVSKFSGGYGCVRDLIESVMRSQGTWEKASEMYF